MPTLRIVARSSKIDAAHRDRISSRGSPHIRKLRISGNMRCSAYYPGNFSRVPKNKPSPIVRKRKVTWSGVGTAWSRSRNVDENDGQTSLAESAQAGHCER